MSSVLRRVLATAVMLLAAVVTQRSALSQANDWLEPFPPFRIAGNLYYVGSRGLASYLVTTPEGHILINSNLEKSVPMLRASIEKLGFRIQDVKIMLSSHSHIDHVQGHAAMQKLTGAQIMALGEDAAAIAGGFDNSALGAGKWTPAKVDRVLKLEVQRDMVAPPRPVMAMRAEMAMSAEPPVAPGEMEVRAIVTLTTAIK